MRFSWTGLILAPLLVPIIFCAAMATLSENNNPLLAFLFLMVPSCVVSYGTTIFLFLPALYLLSVWRPMTGLLARSGAGHGGVRTANADRMEK
jgi:hypothetical protein